MILREDTWHFKIYRWWRLTKFATRIYSFTACKMHKAIRKEYEGVAATELPHMHNSPKNLCQYLQVIFLYAPFRFLMFNYKSLVFWLNIFAFSYLYSVIKAPSHFIFASAVITGVVIICVAMIALFFFLDFCEDNVAPKIRKTYRKSKDDFTATNIYKAYKNKVCPFIEFKSEEKGEK